MELRDYLSVIRRRYYVFLPVLLAVIGLHVLWVTYGQQPTHQASAQIALVNVARGQPGSTANSPLWWSGAPTSQAVKALIEDRKTQEEIAALLYEQRDFSLREYKRPPLGDEVDAHRAEFRTHYPERERFINHFKQFFDVGWDNQGIVNLVARCRSRGAALALVWAAADTVVRHYHDHSTRELSHMEGTLQDELETVQSELNSAEERWAGMIAAKGFDPVSRQRRLERDIENLQSECDRLATQQRELARHYRELVQARPLAEGDAGNRRVEEILAQNERVKGLESRLLTLRLELDEMLERRTREHPEVTELEQRIHALEHRLPEVIKEEMAKSLVRVNDRELNEILYQSRKTALDLELKQEQIRAYRQRIQEMSRDAIAMLPVKQAVDEAHTRLEGVVGALNEVKFLGQAIVRSRVRLFDPGRTAVRLSVQGKGAGPFLLSALLGLIAAAAVTYLFEYVDVRVKNESDVRRYLNLPLLGVLPQLDRRALAHISDENSETAERFNIAATLVRTTARELDMHSFAVCSAVAQEGKTTVAVNLAASFARKGTNVILVDADLRIPQVHKVLGLNNTYGLSTVLSGWRSPQQVLDGIMSDEERAQRTVAIGDALQQSAVPGLRVMTSGPPVSSPAKLIESELFRQVLAQLTQEADFVIFDTPPIDQVGDGLTVASLADGCVFVVGAGQCEQHDISWAKHLLTNVQANLLGVFLNRYAQRRTREYGGYHTATRRRPVHA